MTRAPLGDADSARQLDETVSSWAAQWHASALLGVEYQPQPDDRGHFHWLIRLKGEEKDVITLWLSLRQRTVHVETQVTPAPEEILTTTPPAAVLGEPFGLRRHRG